jgi:hypothetical protein
MNEDDSNINIRIHIVDHTGEQEEIINDEHKTSDSTGNNMEHTRSANDEFIDGNVHSTSNVNSHENIRIDDSSESKQFYYYESREIDEDNDNVDEDNDNVEEEIVYINGELNFEELLSSFNSTNNNNSELFLNIPLPISNYDMIVSLLEYRLGLSDIDEEMLNSALRESEASYQYAERKNFEIKNKNELLVDFEDIEANKSEQICSICVQEYTKGERILKLKCEHLFHETCIQECIKYKPVCPLCRHEVIVCEGINDNDDLEINKMDDEKD